MREILFRGHRIDNGEWVYGSLLKVSNQLYIRSIEYTGIGYGFLVTPETIGQFTGLTDKNGVKIFEGDILKCINPNDGEEFITDFIASLVNGFTFKNVSLSRQLSFFDNDWPDEIEVIGNIHENLELL